MSQAIKQCVEDQAADCSANALRQEVRQEEETEQAQSRGPRRLVLSAAAKTPSQSHRTGERTYLSRDGMKVERVFYDSTPMGQEIRHCNEGRQVIATEPYSDRNFSFTADASHPIGDITVIAKRVQHCFAQTPTLFTLRKRLAAAICPYPETYLRSEQNPSATVFEINDRGDEATAFRVNAALLESPQYLQEGGGFDRDEPNDADFLRAHASDSPGKYLDEMEEDDEGSEVSSLHEEGIAKRKDEAEEAEEDGHMSNDHVTKIMNQCIGQYVAGCSEENRQACTDKTIEDEIKQARKDWVDPIRCNEGRAKEQNDRLNKLKAEYLGVQWDSDQELRKVCENMRPTVEKRELYRLMVSRLKECLSRTRVKVSCRNQEKSIGRRSELQGHPETSSEAGLESSRASQSHVIHGEEHLLRDGDDAEAQSVEAQSRPAQVVPADLPSTDVVIISDSEDRPAGSQSSSTRAAGNRRTLTAQRSAQGAYKTRAIDLTDDDVPAVSQSNRVPHKRARPNVIDLTRMRDESPAESSIGVEVTKDSSKQGTARSQKQGKRRETNVGQSQETLRLQSQALQRQKYYDAHKLFSPQCGQHEIAPGALQSINSEILINPLRGDTHDPIYIPNDIGQHLKKHQVAGVRFMWREVTAGAQYGAQSGGCILAHTMGLGKTLQAITLLVCLDLTACSSTSNCLSQLPSSLQVFPEARHLRIVIISPPGLMNNWKSEIETWAGRYLTSIWSIASGAEANLLANWYKEGGILLIGYNMFQQLGNSSEGRSGGLSSKEFRQYLLEGADVVVADEVHNLKNPDAATSSLAKQFRTTTRVGLTGTPMSNNVGEIYALVSWVAPGYLGEPNEFAANFEVPIIAGTYEESTAVEVRNSLKRLAVLTKIIEPKVNRADQSVVRGSLKQKTEFIITVPLSEVPRAVYNRLINVITTGNALEDVSQTKIFSLFSTLTLLVNHPSLFKRKLLRGHENLPPSAEDNMSTMLGPLEGDEVLGSNPSDSVLSDISVGAKNRIVAGIPDDEKPELSVKMLLCRYIVRLAKRCRNKVLVFTNSIPSLHFVERLLKSAKFGCDHIDGTVSLSKRETLIADLKTGALDVLVISTRAGGVGYNIQCANRVIILDHTFNPAHEDQAIGRAYRIGQEKPVFVYRLITGGTFETNIYDKQVFKTSLTSRVVDKKNPIRSTSRQQRSWLYPVEDVPQRDTSSVQGKDPDVLEKILGNYHGTGSYIRALGTMEALQEEAIDGELTMEEKAEVDNEIAKIRGGEIAKIRDDEIAKITGRAQP